MASEEIISIPSSPAAQPGVSADLRAASAAPPLKWWQWLRRALLRHWQYLGSLLGLWRRNKRVAFATVPTNAPAVEVDVPGVCMFDGNFCKRKELYAGFDCDGEINQYTDFFGAASLTCDMLDWLDTSMGRAMSEISPETVSWLEGVSAELEAWNRMLADRIRKKEGPSQVRAELNVHLVRMEQRLVQDALERLKSQRPAEAQEVIRRLSRLLNGGWAQDYGLGKFVLGAFGPAVSMAISRKGCDLDYGCYEDRILIGDCAVELAPSSRNDFLLR